MNWPARLLPAAFAATAFFLALLAAPVVAGEQPFLSPRPGAAAPEPGQRGLDEIRELPTREAACPACGLLVVIPEVDRLMRRAPREDDQPLKWRMHAESRDADFCPHPGRNKVSFQADVVICPSCGFATRTEEFALALPNDAIAWILITLKPNLRDAQVRLLGARAAEMPEEDIVHFFNRQQEIPDIIRLEHLRVYRMAARRPKLEQAEATWLAAWAIRREIAFPPRGDFLSRRVAAVKTAAGNPEPADVVSEIMALD
ncbi:MAG: DUF2225 domain-containing protein, partial [Planctomycetes bacterium]|nr:DUF2225 domain-containing protein [Planctomycetota bacterium]